MERCESAPATRWPKPLALHFAFNTNRCLPERDDLQARMCSHHDHIPILSSTWWDSIAMLRLYCGCNFWLCSSFIRVVSWPRLMRRSWSKPREGHYEPAKLYLHLRRSGLMSRFSYHNNLILKLIEYFFIFLLYNSLPCTSSNHFA